MKNQRAFSLVEVVLAIAVVVVALLTMLALIPLALGSARDSVNYTRTSFIAQDAALRIRMIPGTANPISPPTAGTPFPVLTTNWWYDANGRFLGTNYATALYRVDVKRGTLNSYPPYTNPTAQDLNNAYSTQLEAATVAVGSPVNTANGNLVATAAPTTNIYTFYVRPVPNS